MDVQVTNAQQMRCPRCGYDQRGVVATWIDSCPLEGVCTECGLHIIWAEVLHPDRFEPQWCVECVPRARRVVRACGSTFLRSFWPWRFWSQIKMSHPLRPWRIVSYLGFLIAILLLCYVPIQAGVAIYVRYQFQQYLVAQQTQIPSTIQWMQTYLQGLQSNPTTDPQLAAQQQQSIAMIQQQIARNQQMLASPPILNFSMLQAISEAVFSPLARYSNGAVISSMGSMPYVAPIALWDFALNSSNTAYMGIGNRAFELPIGPICVGLGFGLVMMFLLPGSLVLLPVSRRKAKVRWAHIGRVTAYSAFIPIAVILFDVTLFVTAIVADSATMRSPVDSIHAIMRVVTCAGPPMALILWWGAAIGRYLKIPHGHFTAFVLMILCALLVMASIWVIAPAVLID